MRQRLQITLLVFASFIATGAQWDLVQTFGWARMVVNYSQTMPLLDAVQRTFNGEMCSVCRVVKAVKQQEKQTTLPNDNLDTKLIFVYQPAPEFIAPALDSAAWSHSDMQPRGASRSAPPTPPPRV